MAEQQVAELVSETEYLSTVYEPDAEFVDGVIDHSAWQVAIASFFIPIDLQSTQDRARR